MNSIQAHMDDGGSMAILKHGLELSKLNAFSEGYGNFSHPSFFKMHIFFFAVKRGMKAFVSMYPC